MSIKFSASQMVSVTELLRNFGEVAEKIGEEDLIIVRNNKPDFVLMNFSEYEKLRELDELVEHIEIWKMVEERKKDNRIPGGEVMRKIGLSAEDWEEVCDLFPPEEIQDCMAGAGGRKGINLANLGDRPAG